LEKEAQLQESGSGDQMDMYRKILDAAPDAMLFVDTGGRIVLANAQMEKLFGYSRDEIIDHNVHMLIPERFHGRHTDSMRRFFSEPRKRPMGTGLKIYGRRKDGTEFRADISLSPMEDNGQPFAIAAIRDISERIRELEQMELNFQIQKAISSLLKISLQPVSIDEQLANSLDIILSISNLALQSIGSIYLLDESSEKLVLKAQRGLSENQLQECSELPAGPGTSVGTASCQFAFTGCVDKPNEILQQEVDASKVNYCVSISAGEEVLGLINVSAEEGHMEDPREKAFLNAVADTLAVVVQRYRIENEKQKLRERLSQSEKLAALGRISANVAHEIRNPITVLGGFARRLMKMKEDETRREEYIDFIVSEVSRLERILEDILTYARTTQLRLKENHIHEIVDDVLGSYAEECRSRGISVHKEYEYTSTVSIDKIRVREVLVNVVSNAITAMDKDGKLTAGTDIETVDGMSFVTVRIADTGEGIPQDKFDKIFEPFFTTRISTRGIGLGLAISKKIVEEHGGFITVESTVGTGTTFVLHFPLKKAETDDQRTQKIPQRLRDTEKT
jgi:PAS domain S-box-containing protein